MDKYHVSYTRRKPAESEPATGTAGVEYADQRVGCDVWSSKVGSNSIYIMRTQARAYVTVKRGSSAQSAIFVAGFSVKFKKSVDKEEKNR